MDTSRTDTSRQGAGPLPPELSRPVPIGTIRRDAAVTVEAAPRELAPIARRLGIPAVASLRCRWTLRPRRGDADAFEADGVLDAAVTRICVVTAEPFDETVREGFSVVFVPADALREDEDEDPESPDLLPHDGRVLDLGEATVEQLALALDPFPRSPVAVADADADAADPSGTAAVDGAEAPARPSPFAVLAERGRKN